MQNTAGNFQVPRLALVVSLTSQIHLVLLSVISPSFYTRIFIQRSNLLTATLALIEELDQESLAVVRDAVDAKLDITTEVSYI